MKDFQIPFDPNWISHGFTEETISFADGLGEYLCDLRDNHRGPGNQAMTTTQIRNFFSEVKRIQRTGLKSSGADFLLLKPKIAYAVARATGKNQHPPRIETFRKMIDQAHAAVKLEKEGFQERFSRFVDLLEAILAYHKSYGGRD